MTETLLGRIVVAWLGVSFILPVSIQAALVANGDFETDQTLAVGNEYQYTITSWNVTGSSTAGEYKPAVFSAYLPATLTHDGNIMAFANGGGSINQTIDLTLTSGENFLLTGVVGHRDDSGSSYGAAYAEILIGGSVVAGTTTDISDPGSGNIGTWSLNYTSATSGSTAVEILLGNSSGSGQVNFDNISFTALPEPTDMALGLFGITLAGGLAASRLRTLNKSRAV